VQMRIATEFQLVAPWARGGGGRGWLSSYAGKVSGELRVVRRASQWIGSERKDSARTPRAVAAGHDTAAAALKFNVDTIAPSERQLGPLAQRARSGPLALSRKHRLSPRH
jgi:hypothetical protein